MLVSLYFCCYQYFSGIFLFLHPFSMFSDISVCIEVSFLIVSYIQYVIIKWRLIISDRCTLYQGFFAPQSRWKIQHSQSRCHFVLWQTKSDRLSSSLPTFKMDIRETKATRPAFVASRRHRAERKKLDWSIRRRSTTKLYQPHCSGGASQQSTCLYDRPLDGRFNKIKDTLQISKKYIKRSERNVGRVAIGFIGWTHNVKIARGKLYQKIGSVFTNIEKLLIMLDILK